MVEHLHATGRDIRGQDLVVTASMGSADTIRRQHVATGSFFDAIFTCVIYTLGWFLVAATDL